MKRRSPFITAAIITGVCAIVAATVGGLFVYFKPGTFGGLFGNKFYGRIIDTESEKAVQRAKVAIESKRTPSIVYTDDEGSFSFPIDEHTDDIRIRVEAAGYEVLDRRIAMSKDRPVEDVRLKPLVPIGGATGTPTVRKPAANAKVMSEASDWRTVSSRYRTEWRIGSAEFTPDKARFYLDVRNTLDKESAFYSFDEAPLAIVDDKGRFYKMIYSSNPPPGVSKGSFVWTLQASRVITIIVDFEPLPADAQRGKIQYQRGNQATPLNFEVPH